MRYTVRHETRYRYSRRVTTCHNVVHLKPRSDHFQLLQSCDLVVVPEPAAVHWQKDQFGNDMCFFAIHEPHTELVIEANSVVQVLAPEMPAVRESPPWESMRNAARPLGAPETLEAYQFVFDSPYVKTGDDLEDYAQPSFPPGRPLLEAVADLNVRINREFKYSSGATDLATPIRDVMRKREGVCQDFAHLMIGCIRSVGLPARYVSGYLMTQPPPGRAKLVGSDQSHAWVSVYCPGTGWVDFDPTNAVMPEHEHITTAIGRDYDDVSPIKGVYIGGGTGHTLSVAVDVIPQPVQGG